MLQKGIIELIEDKFTAKVRIPKYDKLESSADGIKTKDLSTGIVCTLPGMSVTYSIGDVVLVDFENDELSKPVILGLLYRDHESDSVLQLDGVDSSIEDINHKISELESSSLYTHIKYSNDGGKTFTSLFDYEKVKETDTFSIISSEQIYLDNTVSSIYWSIINDENVDIIQNLSITTSVFGENKSKGLSISREYKTANILLPLEFQACSTIYMTFEINISLEELKKYYVCLTTDVNSIGSVYGDYIGICVSNLKEPSQNTIDYTWTSIVDRNEFKLGKVEDDLLRRIRANERDLRGYSEDVFNNSGEVDETGVSTSLLDAIEVNNHDVIIGKNNRDTVYFKDNEQYINLKNSDIHITSVTQKEFNFKRVIQDGIPHLILTLTERE